MATRKEYSSTLKLRKVRIFSEELRRKIVKDIEGQKLSFSEASREYEVSLTSLYRWHHKYSPYSKRGEKIIVESKSQTKKVEELKERIKELERIIGQKQLLLDFKDKMIEIAEEKYKIDIKKKFGSQPSSGTGTTGRSTEQR